jgi:hypothetical protein
MSIILPTLAVAFAAFCVWLGVRVYNRRERWAKWTAVALTFSAVAYLISIGPACWISSKLNCGTDILARCYSPLIRLSLHDVCPSFVHDDINWYCRLGADSGWGWFTGAVPPINRGGATH